MNNSNEWKKSGQIPAFGNWDYTSGLPITQYFECARQAGLSRYCTSSSGQCNHCFASSTVAAAGHAGAEPYLYAFPSRKPILHAAVVPPTKTKAGSKQAKGQSLRKQQPVSHKQFAKRTTNSVRVTTNKHKASNAVNTMEEDLYKISPELLQTSKPMQKKFLGFFSSCLAPVCAA